ncbi:carboxymuconolactone decarboxylase family protein [Propylenella binzhouense]|uniref:Carboxymuconolactone decarboxylase family protein n=1 Tax=Propylenella binzhouense TaxID=2555902 RepID=A0A964T8E3_9HYPH|nr:carboxymuconolactone decarboxylase family protein [Propylenella binzhouense]MYZ50370.1 carboxymuconolactone decarboxylase family protein [Propylenella binzhouense]
MPRIPPVDPGRLTPEQAAVHERIASGARGSVRGPFAVLLHSPELAGFVEQLGAYVRYRCRIPKRQREIAILVVAAHWRASYEWEAHAPIARGEGVPDEIIAAIAAESEPPFEDERDRLVHTFARESLAGRRVSDATFAGCREAFGEAGAVDLAGLVGYYTLLALAINALEVEPPAGRPFDIPCPR